MHRRSVLLSLLGVLWALPAMAQPHLVKDIDPIPRPGSSWPEQFGRFGNYALFAATTLSTGRELWASDGTQAGTFLLVDACPAECSGDPRPAAVTPRGYFFTTPNDRSGQLLWVTQGTPATTFLLKDDLAEFGDSAWVESPGVLYFASNGGLWRTDGTATGTFLVANTGQINGLVAFKGRVFFSAYDVSGPALWTSDGTAAGTRLVKDTSPLPAPSSFEGPLRHLLVAGNALFFWGPGTAGWELWRSDGTTKGTRMVIDLVPGLGSPHIYDVTTVGSRLYMAADRLDGQGQELWVSDGTRAGTQKLTNFVQDQPFYPRPLGSPFRTLTAATSLGNQLFFAAANAAQGAQLWVTNGTVKGTRSLTSFCPGSCVGVVSVWPAQHNQIFFTGSDGPQGLELWTTNGTTAGTHIVRDLCPGGCSSFPRDPFICGSQLLFVADDGQTGPQLWRIDGTASGPVRVSDFTTANFENGFQGAVTADRLLFAASDGDHGNELWVSDGTLAGTRLLADIDSADHGGSTPSTFMTAAGNLFFFADDGQHGKELWKSDGTEAGTTLVHEFAPGPEAQVRFESYAPGVEIDGTLFCALETELSLHALWRTDGTDAGTFRLTPEDVDVRNAFGGGLVPVGGKVFFTASESLHGRELWVTDGTPAGARMVADLQPGPYSSEPFSLIPFQDKVYFIAQLPDSSERVLWRSDGTEAGTSPATEVARSAAALTLHQGLLYFLTDAGNRPKLWRSDGTAAGTVMMTNPLPGPSSPVEFMLFLGSRLLLWAGGFEPGLWVNDGAPAGLKQLSSLRLVPSFVNPSVLVIDGVAYFSGSNSSGRILWRTDGTEAGTFPLRDRSGRTLTAPDIMAAFDGRLYFVTPDPNTTLWQSDGTLEGTVPLRELEPGNNQRSPALAVAGSRLFFRASDPATGTELWAIDKR
jgi:ELWxxDGT repeat protein